MICKKFHVLPSQVDQEDGRKMKKIIMLMGIENELHNAYQNKIKKKQKRLGRKKRASR